MKSTTRAQDESQVIDAIRVLGKSDPKAIFQHLTDALTPGEATSRMQWATALHRLHEKRLLQRTGARRKGYTYGFAPRRGPSIQKGPIVSPDVLVTLIRSAHPDDLFPLVWLLFKIRESMALILDSDITIVSTIGRRPRTDYLRERFRTAPDAEIIGLLLRIFVARRSIPSLLKVEGGDILRLQSRMAKIGGPAATLGTALVRTLALRRASRRLPADVGLGSPRVRLGRLENIPGSDR